MSDQPPARYPRRRLVLPFAIVGVLLAIWTIWWFVLASQVEKQLGLRTEQLREAGWTIEPREFSGVSGWPFRVRVEAPEARIGAPSGHMVAAPRLVAEAMAWNPDKWVLIAPDGLTLTRPDKGRVAVGGVIRASASGLRRRTPNLALEMVEPVFTPHSGAEVFPIRAAQRFELYARKNAANPGGTDVLLRLVDAQGRPAGPVEGLSQQGRLSLELEATLTNAQALRGMDAAGVFAAWTEAGGRFAAVKGEISAGESRALISSEGLRADEDGRLVGAVAFRAEKPLSAIAGLARSRDGAVNRVGAAGAAAATAAGGNRDVALTIEFRDGRTWLGPFPLSPAPKLF